MKGSKGIEFGFFCSYSQRRDSALRRNSFFSNQVQKAAIESFGEEKSKDDINNTNDRSQKALQCIAKVLAGPLKGHFKIGVNKTFSHLFCSLKKVTECVEEGEGDSLCGIDPWVKMGL